MTTENDKLIEAKLNDALKNSALSSILETLVQNVSDSIKQLADYGIDEATKIAIKFIQDKLGNEV